MRFVGVVVTGVVAFGCTAPTEVDTGPRPFWARVDLDRAVDLGHRPTATGRSSPGPIQLTDVTEAAGLGEVIGGGNSHGVGVAFVDLDGDDWADIFVANGRHDFRDRVTPSFLYRNNQDGTFTDATARSGVAELLRGADLYSVAAADYDGDGDVDLYLGAQPKDILLENMGDGRFMDATARAGAGGPTSDASLVNDGRSKVVAWGDYDGDGHLDIVSSSSTLPDPYAYLLRNKGDGTFEDVTVTSGVQADPIGNPCAVMWSDYDNDGDVDLWIWNDRGGHILLNNDAGTLVDATKTSRLDEVRIDSPMGIDAADIDHDGDLDYYISNSRNNPLLRNNGDGTFTDITRSAGTGGEFGWGLALEDFDADTWPDIFVAQEDDLPHLLFRNQGVVPSRFEEIEVDHPEVLSPEAHNVAVGFADYDHDGRTDILAATTDESRVTLYRNETDLGGGHWLHVSVPRGPGGAAGGIGGRVIVVAGSTLQFRDLTAGSSRASQNEHTVRFGLGPYDGADWVAVIFENGDQYVVRGVRANQRLTLTPPPAGATGG